MKACEFCEQAFAPRKGRVRFCSPSCRTRWSRAAHPEWGHRPQTFRECAYCGLPFGPLNHLKRQFCSLHCKHEAQRVRDRKPRQQPSREARYAQSRVAWLLLAGRLKRPNSCERCGALARIEAAHEDYAKPEAVAWLCVSCHRRWDWATPKGGTRQTADRLGVVPAVSPRDEESAAVHSGRDVPQFETLTGTRAVRQ
jgi:hypothetical protein